jgi:hypothetical protein
VPTGRATGVPHLLWHGHTPALQQRVHFVAVDDPGVRAGRRNLHHRRHHGHAPPALHRLRRRAVRAGGDDGALPPPLLPPLACRRVQRCCSLSSTSCSPRLPVPPRAPEEADASWVGMQILSTALGLVVPGLISRHTIARCAGVLYTFFGCRLMYIGYKADPKETAAAEFEELEVRSLQLCALSHTATRQLRNGRLGFGTARQRWPLSEGRRPTSASCAQPSVRGGRYI